MINIQIYVCTECTVHVKSIQKLLLTLIIDIYTVVTVLKVKRLKTLSLSAFHYDMKMVNNFNYH